MAITTYTELETAVKNWLHRADLDNRIPEFIALAEARFYIGSNPVRTISMQARTTGTTASGALSLPSDYLETIRLVCTSSGKYNSLEYMTADLFSKYEDINGIPRWFTLLNGEIKTAPNSDADYVLDYYKRLPSLESTTTNAILTAYPNLYLYGALLEASPYVGDNAETMLWAQAYDDAVKGINKSENKKFESASMSVKAN